jgi:hypothetical protein
VSAIILRNDSALSVELNPDALAMQSLALHGAALVGKVTNPAENENAVAAQRELRRCIKLCEDARVEIKAPVIEYGKRIDSIAKSFKEPLAEEQLRVARLIADFAALEQAKVRAAEAAKRLEEERLERERQAEAQRIREEEWAKQRVLDAEAARIEAQAREARTAKARAEAETARLELERQRALAAVQTHDALDAANERHCEQVAALPTVTAARAEGQVVKWDWEISVSDVHALYRAHPLCCKVTPLLSESQSLLDAGVQVRGVVAKKVPKSSVRIGGAAKFIEA